MEVLIIYDYDENSGLGHKTRMEALQEAFMTEGIKPAMMIYSAGMQLSYASYYKYVIVDSYLADYDFYNSIQAVTNLVVIDDYKRLEYPEGCIIVNPNLYGEEIWYPTDDKKYYHILAGPKYVLLRKPFWYKKKKKINKKVKNILITLGGTEYAKELIEEFTDKLKGYHVRVMFPTERYIFTAEQVKHNMYWADIAITNCGVTSLEAISVGVPIKGFMTADNQENNLFYFMKNGIELVDGLSKSFNNSLGSVEFSAIRRKQCSSYRDLIDGVGVLRLAQNLVDLDI